MKLTRNEIIQAALIAGFSLSTAYGQDTDKFMPMSDEATLQKFAELILKSARSEQSLQSTPSPQDHIERLLRDFDLFAAEQTTDGAYQVMDSKHHREPMRAFLSSSLHSLAEAQKAKALEVVRRTKPKVVFTDQTKDEYQRIYTSGADAARSKVEEAIKREL